MILKNVGGLLQVIAVPPASFVQIRKDYAAGLNYLELRNREDIVSIPVYANDTYSYNEDKEVNDAGGLLECVGRRGDSKTFLSESSFNGDAGAWLVVCTGSGRQRGGPLVRAGGRTHAVQHEQDKRTFRVGTERYLIHVSASSAT